MGGRQAEGGRGVANWRVQCGAGQGGGRRVVGVRVLHGLCLQPLHKEPKATQLPHLVTL